MGHVRPDLAAPGTKLQVKMFDRLWPVRVAVASPDDPENANLRAHDPALFAAPVTEAAE